MVFTVVGFQETRKCSQCSGSSRLCDSIPRGRCLPSPTQLGHQPQTGLSCGWWESLWLDQVTGASPTGSRAPASGLGPEGKYLLLDFIPRIILHFSSVTSVGNPKNSLQLLFSLVYFSVPQTQAPACLWQL